MKRIYLLLLALGALSSCSKDAAQTPGTTDGRIRIVAGVAETRAVTDASTGLTGASFVVKEGGATAPASFAGGTLYTGDVAAVSGEVTFTSTTPPSYNMNDANAWFAAYAPGGALTSDAIEWAIDGKTDIMVTNTVWDAGKYTAPVTTGLTFNHQLSQVEVICRAAAGENTTAQSSWGKITKIEFVGASEKMKYDLNATPATAPASAVSVSGSADLPLLADYNGTAFTELAIPANDNTTVNAVAMVAPVAATATESFKLKVTTSGAAATPTTPIVVVVPVSINGSLDAMTAGRKYKATITFKATAQQIEATAEIAEWGYPEDHDMEINQFYVPMFYGDALNNGGVTTAFTGAAVTSYNALVVGANGTAYADATAAYTGEPPYKRLQVARKDEADPKSWAEAMTACASKITDGGGWRLPRIAELKMMHNNKASLEAEPGFTAFVGELWGGTESTTSGSAFAFALGSGAASGKLKTTGCNVRCVREMVVNSYPYVVDGKYIVSKDVHGSSTRPLHDPWSMTPVHNELSADNAVGWKIEVAYRNCNLVNAPAPGVTPKEGDGSDDSYHFYYAKDAAALCAAYSQTSGAAGTWRLPTKQELNLIGEVHSQLTGVIAFPFSPDGGYCSSTEDSSDSNKIWCDAPAFYDPDDDASPVNKNTYYSYVRCVRDEGLRTYPYVVDGTAIIVSKDSKGSSAGPFHDKWTTTPAHNETSAENAVGAKFEVAVTECNATSAPGVTETSGNYLWSDAAAACAAYSQGGGTAGIWRLPTIKEWELINSMQNQLYLDAFVSLYCSATENSTDNNSIWAFQTYGGAVGSISKGRSDLFPVRCVRDL